MAEPPTVPIGGKNWFMVGRSKLTSPRQTTWLYEHRGAGMYIDEVSPEYQTREAADAWLDGRLQRGGWKKDA